MGILPGRLGSLRYCKSKYGSIVFTLADEVFSSHLPDHSEMVSYSVFLQALYRYSGAQMRFGR
jgi:hypothetical protein